MSAAIDTVGTRARQGQVLVVDDDPGTVRILSERLTGAQYEVESATTAQDAVEAAEGGQFDVILLDVNLPDGTGIDALRRIKAGAVTAGVVMISGAGDAETVVEAIRLGALDYLIKPLDADKTLATVSLAARTGRLERENRRLSRKLQELEAGTQLIGHSPAARRLASVVRRVADSDATVLIESKSGSGKTCIAETVHRSGRRCDAPFVAVLAEGLEPEAFQDALIEADAGTLLIEDVETLPASTQSRLVRHLKERPASPGGAAGARVIATTSARLPELVAKGKFREDLFYRLNVFPIVVPSLAERRDDIPLFAAHFLAECAEGKTTQGFSTAAMILLETHPWPGNLIQLRNAVSRAYALAAGAAIDRVHLLGPSTGLTVEEAQSGLTRMDRREDDDDDVREEDVIPFEAEEKRILARALRATKGNVRRAAQLLRIGRATLYRKIQVYKLKLH